MNVVLTPEVLELIFALGKAAVTEAPVVIDAIERALHGTDPLAGLEAERLSGIMAGGLHLPIMVAADKLALAHAASPVTL
jgi:hypothetical protein